MTIDRQTLLFIDASSLFLAAKTPIGGSAYILKISQFGFLNVSTSSMVLEEAERNLLLKVSVAAVHQHRLQVVNTPFTLVSVPSPALIQHYTREFGTDDHVVAAALAAKAQFLITVDIPLITKLTSGNYPIVAITPKEFLEEYFPQHPDHALVRSIVQ